MEKYYAGVLLGQKAVEWWPYLKKLVDKFNEAAETRNAGMVYGCISDAGDFARSLMEETTVSELKEKLKEELDRYKWIVENCSHLNKKLKNPVGKKGPLKESTLKSYRSGLKSDIKIRDERKKEIQELVRDIKAHQEGKLFRKNGSTFTLHYGGKYPARLSVQVHNTKTKEEKMEHIR